ncbi:MAG: cell division protein FtsW [Atopobiaceae bacterium]|nr:cell division protein FtsW [Atopobiaceae bacterium]
MIDTALGLFGLERHKERGQKDARARGLHVPAVAPHILFGAIVVALLVFGMLMIYSASSISGLMSKENGFDPAYYLVRQIAFSVAGLVFAGLLMAIDYHRWFGRPLIGMWAGVVGLLLLVFTPVAGQDINGASRWIALGPFTLQPSEFTKVMELLVGSYFLYNYFELRSLDQTTARRLLLLGVGVPLALVVLQPDKGTTGVIVMALIFMAYLAGLPGRSIAKIVAVFAVLALVYSLKDEYSRARVMTMINPFKDEYGSGYQLLQGFYALGSGGVTGVGLGMSRQKYNYLPMAHNDFIFAVVGEELGLVGTVALVLAFVALLWAGLKIAENAPDLPGKLVAAGGTAMLVIQMLLNVSGVVGVFPLSGKPIPFVSYGGSSVVTSLMLAGLVLSVALRSDYSSSEHEARRANLRIAPEEPEGIEGSTAGRATPRSARLAGERMSYAPRSDLRVVQGGKDRSTEREDERTRRRSRPRP